MNDPNKPLWHNPEKKAPDATFLRFCSWRDVIGQPAADYWLVPYDLWTNVAHVTMLREVGMMSAEDAKRVLGSLHRLHDLWKEGDFPFDSEQEDVHSMIETAVGKDVGAQLSGRIHTGRSRNDQVATDMRMFLRSEMINFGRSMGFFVEYLTLEARRWEDLAMPGMTHHQPAGVTTLGHWAAGHAQAFLRDLARVHHTLELLDACPLGATASYGTSWPIDRERTARLLGFSRVQHNSLDCISSRWEIEAEAGHALATFMVHASMMAQDLILWSSHAFGYITLAEEHTTGSSVMPQKRNPDPCEVIKAKAAVAQQLQQALRAIPTGNVSAYNRDSQWTKYLFMDLMSEVVIVPEILASLLSGMKPNRERMRAAGEGCFLTALDVAESLAQRHGLPFRQAYRVVSTAVTTLQRQDEHELNVVALNQALEREGLSLRLLESELEQAQDWNRALHGRASAGSPNPREVRETCRIIKREVVKRRKWLNKETERVNAALERCLGPGDDKDPSKR